MIIILLYLLRIILASNKAFRYFFQVYEIFFFKFVYYDFLFNQHNSRDFKFIIFFFQLLTFKKGEKKLLPWESVTTSKSPMGTIPTGVEGVDGDDGPKNKTKINN